VPVGVADWLAMGRVNQQPDHVRRALAPLVTRASSHPDVVKMAIDYSFLYLSRIDADDDPLSVQPRDSVEDLCQSARSIIEVIESSDLAISDAIDAWCRAVWLSR
jgi:hypothetical protein